MWSNGLISSGGQALSIGDGGTAMSFDAQEARPAPCKPLEGYSYRGRLPLVTRISVLVVLVGAIGSVGSVALPAAVAQAQPTSWTTAPGPVASQSSNVLDGVSCTSASSCMAVGYYLVGSVDQTLAETFNGSSWSILTTPDKGTGNNALNGVSCSEVNLCVAVGYRDTKTNGGSKTLVEVWNGTDWSIQPSRNSSGALGNALSGVSCTNSTFCMAVGHHSDGGFVDSLAEVWNGTSWSITPTPDVTDDTFLDGVSCTSTTNCVVAGYTANPHDTQTVIEAWNGATWSVDSSTDPANDSYLDAVSCANPANCQAVGYYSSSSDVLETLVESWNGKAWTTSSSPSPGTSANALLGVSCSSSTSCVAVGYYSNGSTDQSLVETYDGTWSVTPSGNEGTGNNVDESVNCPKPRIHQLVGYFGGAAQSQGRMGQVKPQSTSVAQTMDENFNNGKTWTVAPTPNEGYNVNSAVSCVGSSFCVAVGYYENSSDVLQTLVEAFNGTNWTIVSSPNEGTYDELEAVSCFSSTFCEAVGFYDNSSNLTQTLVETFNGTSWSITSSPSKSEVSNVLQSVSCPSSTFCAAAGFESDSDDLYQTLIETFNGTSWSINSSPNEGKEASLLLGVSCVSSTFCQAVGYYQQSGDEGTGPDNLAETFNGTKWLVTLGTTGSAEGDALNAVSCVNTDFCEAVGYAVGEGGTTPETYWQTWSGSGWSGGEGPNQGSLSNELNAVSCTSSTDCVAVGFYALQQGESSSINQTLAESFDGSWSIVSSPDIGTSDNGFAGVACSTATFCVGVGYYLSGNEVPQTLIETSS
ncbi:MAG: hypothetical protein WAM97_05185 [Acidimicrobiales bacterium]